MSDSKGGLPNLQLIILDHRRVELDKYLNVEHGTPGSKSYYSFVNFLNNSENPGVKVSLTIFVPFRIQHNLDPSTIKIGQHPAVVNLWFNNKKVKSVGKSNNSEINFVLDFDTLSTFTAKDGVNIVLPVDTTIVPETLHYLYVCTNNTLSGTPVWVGLKSNIVYSNLESTNQSILTQCSCFDQLQVIYNYSTNIKHVSNGFNGDYVISYMLTTPQQKLNPTVFLDRYRFEKVLPQITHAIPHAITDITPNFSEFNHLLPIKFIDEKIYNVSFWVHEYKKGGNLNFGRMHLWRIVMSLCWLFFVYGLISSVSYLQSIVFYLLYTTWLVIPQILKKNYFKIDFVENNTIEGNLNNIKTIAMTHISVRRINNIFVSFDWKLLMLYYLTPLDSIILIITSGMTLLLYMSGF